MPLCHLSDYQLLRPIDKVRPFVELPLDLEAAIKTGFMEAREGIRKESRREEEGRGARGGERGEGRGEREGNVPFDKKYPKKKLHDHVAHAGGAGCAVERHVERIRPYTWGYAVAIEGCNKN